MTNKYEVMYIINNDLSPEEIKQIREKMLNILIADGGNLDKETDMGKKELAYEINKQKLGFYVLLDTTSTPAAIAEFERISNIEKGIIRYIVVKK